MFCDIELCDVAVNYKFNGCSVLSYSAISPRQYVSAI